MNKFKRFLDNNRGGFSLLITLAAIIGVVLIIGIATFHFLKSRPVDMGDVWTRYRIALILTVAFIVMVAKMGHRRYLKPSGFLSLIIVDVILILVIYGQYSVVTRNPKTGPVIAKTKKVPKDDKPKSASLPRPKPSPAPTTAPVVVTPPPVPDQSQAVAAQIESLKQEFKQQLSAAKDSILTAIKKQQTVVKKQIVVVQHRSRQRRMKTYDCFSTSRSGNSDEYTRSDGTRMRVIVRQ